jgi:alkylation response protein AidB-like acyl-CoA dehydrogenase
VARTLLQMAYQMDFGWSSETKDLMKVARRFAEDNLSTKSRPAGFDGSAWTALANFGLLSLPLPEAWGGRDRGALVTAAVMEALGRGGADRGLLFAIGAHIFGCAVPLTIYGSTIQAERWGGGLRSGSVIGALAVTEVTGGSSLDLLATTARESSGGYFLSGEKTLIANAPVAGLFLVLARQFRDLGPFGFTAFLVPVDTPGLEVSVIDSDIGLPGAPLGRVRMDNCFLSEAAVVGRPGAGLKIFATAMQWERSCLLAGFLGAAQRDLVTCDEALQLRRDGGGSIIRHQGVSHRLARTKLKLESARLLVYRAAWCIDHGHEDYAAAAMAKLAASEAVVDAATDCLRLMAGSAWLDNRFNFIAILSDVIGGLFASGTSEMQLDILARDLQSEHPPL